MIDVKREIMYKRFTITRNILSELIDLVYYLTHPIKTSANLISHAFIYNLSDLDLLVGDIDQMLFCFQY